METLLTHRIGQVKYQPKEGVYYSFQAMHKVKSDRSKLSESIAIEADAAREKLGDRFIVETTKKGVRFTPTPELERSLLAEISMAPIPRTEKIERVVVDYSSPNIAKEMHVGHLRSTIIGDAIANIFEAAGHRVERVNHVGDYGTHFGMLIEQMREEGEVGELKQLQQLYQRGKKRYASDPDFQVRARQTTADFQRGDPTVIEAWTKLCDISRTGFNEIYGRLNVKLQEVGESFYQPMIPVMIDEIRPHLCEEEGCLRIYRDRPGVPLTVRKSDGASTYDTTDLAALRYRLHELKADRVYYVVDHGQSLHFSLLFHAAHQFRWWTDDHRIEHLGFGVVLGEDRKRLRSSDGESIPLLSLLDQGLERTREALKSGNSAGLSDEELEENLPKVAYAAIKYADLSTSREADYVFSFDRMLSLKGNTALYLMYGYVRLGSIIRKAKSFGHAAPTEWTTLGDEPEEIDLRRLLLRWPTVWDETIRTLEPHRLCTYLYQLSTGCHRFAHRCRVLEFDGEELRTCHHHRLQLIELTRRLTATIFRLLGFEPIDRL